MPRSNNRPRPALLMNAKWDSDVGYAWWLMESYWATLANRFSADVRPLLAYPSISRIPEVIEHSQIEVFETNFAHFGCKYLIPQLRFIRQHRVQYLYLTDSPVRHWSYLLYRLAGVRRIAVHDHTPGVRTVPTGWKQRIKRLAAWLPWLNADVLIGASDFVRERLVKVVCAPSHKCHTVPNGIMPLAARTELDAHKLFGIPPERPIIVTTARANEYKGGRFALDALKRLKQNHPDLDWHYLFMGDGPDREAFVQQARVLGLKEYVSFPGKVMQAAGLLGNCGIAFHPSRGEVGYCLAILEYMQAGLPVVVPDNPSVCEATEDKVTGRLYEEFNAEAAASALAAYLQSPALRGTHGDAAKRVIEQRYSLALSHQALADVMSNHVFEPGLE